MKETTYTGRIGNTGTQVVKAPNQPRNTGTGKVKTGNLRDKAPKGK